MAEGDSILRLAQRFEAAMAGSSVAVSAPGRRRPVGRPQSELEGRSLLRAESRGKHLILHFSGGLALHSHLGMRGTWHLYRQGERWRFPPASAWIALRSDSVEAVNFGGSTLRVASEAELERDPRLRRLGPDLLADGFDPAEGVRALRGLGANAELGEALLDQTAVAAIGNIFKSEGCFAARLDPWATLGELDDAQLSDVLEKTRSLMLAAVENGRATKRIYRRAGMPCPRCRERIRSRGQGDSARTTYWCPRCQRSARGAQAR